MVVTCRVSRLHTQDGECDQIISTRRLCDWSEEPRASGGSCSSYSAVSAGVPTD